MGHESIPYSPPLSFQKFISMQEKRVVVTICYREGLNHRPFFLTASKKIKDEFPDVLIEKRILSNLGEDTTESIVTPLEILVDGRLVAGKKRNKKQPIPITSPFMFISMRELDIAIHKA